MRLLIGGEFNYTDPRHAALLIVVGDEIARTQGIDPADLPGSPLQVPDDLRGAGRPGVA